MYACSMYHVLRVCFYQVMYGVVICNSVLLGERNGFECDPNQGAHGSYVEVKVPYGRQWILYKMQRIIFKHLRFDQTFFTYI